MAKLKKITNPDRLDMSTIPDDVLELIGPLNDDEDDLKTLGMHIEQLWKEARDDRAASGIEQVWINDEEAYLGMDDANRSEFSGANWIKPPTKEGPIITSDVHTKSGEQLRSTAFVRLTSRYVDAGYAKLCEILLPVDEKSFSLSATPVPEIIKYKEDNSQVVHDGMPLERTARPEEIMQMNNAPTGGTTLPGAVNSLSAPGAVQPGAPTPPPGAPQVPLKVKDLAEEAVQLATKKAKAAEKRISDWLVECQWHAEMRKVIFDMARIGVGVFKAPFPQVRKALSIDENNEVQISDKIKPAAKWVNAWNFFPAPGCGEEVRNANHCFERDHISTRQLLALKDDPTYISEQIDMVLKEGPGRILLEAGNPNQRNIPSKNKDTFEIIYFHGMVRRKAALAAVRDRDVKRAISSVEDDYVHGIITMVNNHVIRASLNPLKSGRITYHAIPWQRRVGNWAGVGVAEQIVMPQKMVNAATRSMINNAGKSAGTQIVIDRESITPANGNYTIVPDKVWYKNAGTLMDDVRKAFMAVQIPNVTPQLMKIIEYGFRLAEESTSIPLITQGQSGTSTPDTYGAAQLQNNNANQLLRSVAYSVDDCGTEPMIRGMYEWLLLDPDVPDDEKGDFQINAHGSIALVERSIQDQTIMQMGAMVTNAAFGIDPKKWFKVMAKSKHLNPADLQYTEEEMTRIESTPPPPAPPVQAAQIRVDGSKEIEQMKLQGKEADRQLGLQKMKEDTDRDTAYTQALTQGKLLEHQARMKELELELQIKTLEFATRESISLTDAKTRLAEKQMTLHVQKDLSHDEMSMDFHKHHNPVAKPAAEPPGKAPNGKGFTR